MREAKNEFMILLDQYFESPEIKDIILEFTGKTKGHKKWLLYSDYCLDDKNKPNDVMTFVLMPFINEKHYVNMQDTIASLQPKDIKHTSKISTDFLHFIKNEPVFVCSFVLDERKYFFGDEHKQRVDNVIESLRACADGYTHWCSTAVNDDMLDYYKKTAKTLKTKVSVLENAKTPNVKLFSDILLTAFLGAYIVSKILQDVEVDTFGWFSDRDKIISGEDNIVTHIFNYFLHNMWHGKKQYQFCTSTPDDRVPPFYEEFNRMADVVTGTLADYNMKENLISADKFDTVLREFLANNQQANVFRFFKEESHLRLARIVIERKS